MTSSNDPMATVRQYVDAFNRGDAEAMIAACADPMQILDGMSPHVWQGIRQMRGDLMSFDAVRKRDQHGESAGPFHESRDRGRSGPHHQITLPVAGDLPALDFDRPFADRHQVADDLAPVRAVRSFRMSHQPAGTEFA
ncbi:nuclear transport factor 2-like protein [Nocardia stercoris]|uniref:SnoaL-like domain-containing protein n=1 Tax=Nocardia stercoris TaxID=2483361 RepID=A0A3M2L564_9NOCA|nr:hypothetical protein [Nocardia stercoris]RMI32096.1 hypothetical protein EBN03_13840 [Nocardia stercoris]